MKSSIVNHVKVSQSKFVKLSVEARAQARGRTRRVQGRQRGFEEVTESWAGPASSLRW